MEKKLKGFLVILGTLIMGSIAFTPLTSYAAECSKTDTSGCAKKQANQEVIFNVNGYLTLDDVTKNINIRIAPDQKKTDTLTAMVTSSSKFTISLSAAQPNLVKSGSSEVIPGGTSSTSGKGWGIKKKDAAGNDLADYSSLTATPAVFYTGAATNNTSAKYNFEVGVWVDGTVEEGSYSTEVTVTAAVAQ